MQLKRKDIYYLKTSVIMSQSKELKLAIPVGSPVTYEGPEREYLKFSFTTIPFILYVDKGTVDSHIAGFAEDAERIATLDEKRKYGE